MNASAKTVLGTLATSLIVVACTVAPSGDPTATNESGPAAAVGDAVLVSDAAASADVVEQMDLLREAGWVGGDVATAWVEHTPKGTVVAFPFAWGEDAHADLVYTIDEAGEIVVGVRPADAASAKTLESTASGSPPDDVLSDAELAKLVAEPEPDAQLPETQAWACGTLPAGSSLHRGQRITSCHNGYYLIMQNDGNLVVYGKYGAALWSTKTNGKGGYRATMQSDGNFVVYDSKGHALWATGHRYAGDWLQLHDNGELVRDTCGTIHWRNNQYCDSLCTGFACKGWACSYESNGGFNPACFSLWDNPEGAYHYNVVRSGHTVPGFCGTGLYADYAGNGHSCPTTHVLKLFACGKP